MKYIFSLCLILISLACGAAVYMQVDKNGNTAYSDTPQPNSEKIEVSVPNASPPLLPPATVQKKAPTVSAEHSPADEKKPYTTFIMKLPNDQQTFQNQRDISAEFIVEPELQKGDAIKLYVDNKQVGAGVEDTHLQVSQLDRGAHQIYGVLVDSQQNVLKQTNPVTIYIHYASTNGQ